MRAAAFRATGAARGQRSLRSTASSFSGVGRRAHCSRTAATSSSRSTPGSRPRKILSSRSITGWLNGRSSSASGADSTCTVERIAVIRTTAREAISSDSSAGSKPSSRAARPRYGGRGSCPWSPTSASTAAGAGIRTRRSSSCRSSVARLSCRVVSTVAPGGRELCVMVPP